MPQISRIDPTPFFRKKRYLIVFMAFLGYINLYTLRVNMSVAIVALTENRTVEHDDGSVTYEQYFDWSSQAKGYALSSFFYGYIVTQIPGGVLASKIGGQWVRIEMKSTRENFSLSQGHFSLCRSLVWVFSAQQS
jgi:MFS family permease